jgi:hypothetical protein
MPTASGAGVFGATGGRCAWLATCPAMPAPAARTGLARRLDGAQRVGRPDRTGLCACGGRMAVALRGAPAHHAGAAGFVHRTGVPQPVGRAHALRPGPASVLPWGGAGSAPAIVVQLNGPLRRGCRLARKLAQDGNAGQALLPNPRSMNGGPYVRVVTAGTQRIVTFI